MKEHLKTFLISLFTCVIIFGFVSESFAAVTLRVYFRRYQVGGTESVDNIPYATLMDAAYNVHFAMVATDAKVFIPYLFDKTSSDSEDSPIYDTIIPDDQGGNGRWKKVTGLSLGRTATQANVSRSSDATDSDINAQVDISVTDPDSGEEDVDWRVWQQIAGTLTKVIESDADGNIELALDVDLASGKTYKINGSDWAVTTVGDPGVDTSVVTEQGVREAFDGLKKEIAWNIVDSDTQVATGNGVIALTVPASMNSMDLVDAICCVHTEGITGTTDVQIRRRRAGADLDMLSTKITIDTVTFCASDGVINVSNDDINTGDQIYIDVDAIHSGTAAYGLGCTLDFQLP